MTETFKPGTTQKSNEYPLVLSNTEKPFYFRLRLVFQKVGVILFFGQILLYQPAYEVEQLFQVLIRHSISDKGHELII